MAIIDLPTTRAFQGAMFSLGLDVSESTYTGALTGNRTRSSNLADRLRATLTLPPTRDRIAAGQREALLMGLRSAGDWLRMGMPHRPVPAGSLRGSPTVSANALAGARLFALADARAGSNLLRRALFQDFVMTTGWTPNVGTVTPTSAVGVDGTMRAWTLTRTSAGDWYAGRVYTTSSHALRGFTFGVWLKQGTYTGNVVLRVQDDAALQVGARTVTPTASWVYYTVTGAFGGSPASNVRLFIDPVDPGTDGETLLVDFTGLEMGDNIQVNAALWVDEWGDFQGGVSAGKLIENTANSTHFWSAPYTVAANTAHCFSVYLKADTRTHAVVYFGDGDGPFTRVGVLANLTAGTITAADVGTPLQVTARSITSVGNGWHRVSVGGIFDSSSTNGFVQVRLHNGSTSTYTGDGLSGLQFDGPQFEIGGVPTAYSRFATVAAGDFLGAGSNLLGVSLAGATANVAGAMIVPLTMPLPRALTAGAAVAWAAPTGVWELDDDGLQLDYSAPVVQGGVAIPLRQVVL